MAADRKSVVQVKFRLRKDVLRQIEKAAKAADRSTNEEIQRRIEQSFTEEYLSSAFLGGGDTAKALRMIAWAMQLASPEGWSWRENLLSAETVRVAVNRIIAELAGLPEVMTVIDIDEATARERAGEKVPQLEGRYLAAVLLSRADINRQKGS